MSTLVRTWAVTRTAVLRLVRERANLFFVFVFPLALVLLLGQQFGGVAETRVGVVAGSGPSAERIVAALGDLDGVAVRTVADREVLGDLVARGDAAVGLDLGAVAEDADLPVEVGFLARPEGFALRSLVGGVVAREGVALTAAAVVGPQLARDVDAVLAADEDQGIVVRTTPVGARDELAEAFSGLGQFDLSSSTQLLLFMFVTSLSGSAALIQSRQLGVTRRMLSTPTRTGTVLLGEAGGRFAVALVQGLWIVAGTVVLFDTRWGDPLGAALVVLLFAAVCAGAAMLMGAAFSNDAQAGGAGVGLGLGLAALGGCMVPVEVFPSDVAWVVRLTPHGWGNEAFTELVRRDATVVDVLPQLGALAAWAAVLLALATWALRRAVLRS